MKELDPRTVLRSKSKTGLRIAQITDTHLFSDSQRCLLGINTSRSCDEVISLLQYSPHGPFDCVVVTGDLVHDGSPKGYVHLANKLNTLGVPVFCLPGNHDDVRNIALLNRGSVQAVPSCSLGNWALYFLNSTGAGEGGLLDSARLDALDAMLGQAPDKHALICLHHNPVRVGSAWMDTMALANPAGFFGVIDRHPHVRGIIWGHIHQEFEARRDHLMLLGAPSTCVQFVPGSDDFEIDLTPPGFRWMELEDGGNIRTGLERVANVPAGIDMASAGY